MPIQPGLDIGAHLVSHRVIEHFMAAIGIQLGFNIDDAGRLIAALQEGKGAGGGSDRVFLASE